MLHAAGVRGMGLLVLLWHDIESPILDTKKCHYSVWRGAGKHSIVSQMFSVLDSHRKVKEQTCSVHLLLFFYILYVSFLIGCLSCVHSYGCSEPHMYVKLNNSIWTLQHLFSCSGHYLTLSKLAIMFSVKRSDFPRVSFLTSKQMFRWHTNGSDLTWIIRFYTNPWSLCQLERTQAGQNKY